VTFRRFDGPYHSETVSIDPERFLLFPYLRRLAIDLVPRMTIIIEVERTSLGINSKRWDSQREWIDS